MTTFLKRDSHTWKKVLRLQTSRFTLDKSSHAITYTSCLHRQLGRWTDSHIGIRSPTFSKKEIIQLMMLLVAADGYCIPLLPCSASNTPACSLGFQRPKASTFETHCYSPCSFTHNNTTNDIHTVISIAF